MNALDREYTCEATGEIITFRQAINWAADITAGLRTTNSPVAVEWANDRSSITCWWAGIAEPMVYTRD